MRIALYHRVSTIDQDPELADRELHEYAQRLGGEIVIDAKEQASGIWNGRPELQAVVEAARRRRVDIVVVWKLDRFGRSALDLLANIRVLEESRVRFVCITQGIDIKPNGDPVSRLLLTVMAGVAEFERSLIIDRTKLGLARAKALGKHIGRPKAAGPESNAVVAMREAGKSWNEIARSCGCTVAMARRRAVSL